MGNERILISRLVSGSVTESIDKETIITAYNKLGKQEMYDFAKKYKIIPFAAKTFVRLGIDSSYWNTFLSDYKARNLKVIAFLDAAYKAAYENGVRKMFVSENFGSLLAAGTDISLFASGDVDNHAPIEEREKLYTALASIGCRRKERFAKNMQIAAEFFPPEKFGLPEKFYMSVDFYPLARLKLPCFIDSNKFVDWSLLYCYENTHIRLAPPTALAYICMLHTSLHSFMRAPDHRLYIDLYNVSRLNINSEMLKGWSEQDHTKTRIAVACKIANVYMGTSFPDTLLHGKRADKLFVKVFNKEERYLYPEPSKLTVLSIDLMCNDNSNLCGLKEMLSPDKVWMKKVYNGTGIVAHLQHLTRVF